MAWATTERDATWLARLTADIVYPATFLYVDWPGGTPVRASTMNRSLTIGGVVWSGVAHLGYIKWPAYNREGGRLSLTVGLTSLPMDEVDDTIERAAIGRDAIVYQGLFDEAWQDPVLEPTFTGHVRVPGRFRFRRNRSGSGKRWLVDASIEISNGRNPRRRVELHHGPETAQPGDTAFRHLATVARRFQWPSNSN